MSKRSVALLCVLACACCVGPQPMAPGGSTASPGLTARAIHEGHAAPLATDALIDSAGQFRFELRVDRPAYVYLIRFWARGESELLFPVEGHERLQPGEPVRAPSLTQPALSLAGMASDWTFYAVANDSPLRQPVCQLLRLRSCPGEPPPDGGRGGDKEKPAKDKEKDKEKDKARGERADRVPEKPADNKRGEPTSARFAVQWPGTYGITVVPVVLRLE